MTSICEEKNSAEVRFIHTEQISVYIFIVFFKKKKKTIDTAKTKKIKQDI